MSLTMRIVFWLGVSLVFLVAQSSDAQNLHQLSYGSDTVVANRPEPTTPSPIETTTKKGGFFSGLKKIFGRGDSTTTETPTMSTPSTIPQGQKIDGNMKSDRQGLPQQSNLQTPQIQPSNIPQKPGQQGSIVPVANPLGPQPPTPQGPLNPKQQQSERDWVNPSVPTAKPPVIPSQNQINQMPSIQPGSRPSSPQSTRDYVNPNLPPIKPPVAPTQDQINQTPNVQPGSGPTISQTRRDYVNPNLATVKPSVDPGQGSNIQLNNNPSSPNLPGSRPPTSQGTRDYVNPNFPIVKPQDQVTQIPRIDPAINPSPQSSGGSRPSSSQSTRDYVNPNIPNRPSNIPTPQGSGQIRPQTPQNQRDYVNPNLSTNITSTSARPTIADTTLNPEDFPPLAPPRKRPPSRTSGRSNSPTRRPYTSTTQSSASGSVNTPQLATDDELFTLSEALYSADTSTVHNHVTANYQGKTHSSTNNDEAPAPLLQVDERVYENPTVSKMVALYDNYILDTSENEYVSPNERIEENEFIDAVMATPVMRRTMLFLQQKGIVTADPTKQRELLKTIWFNMYSRGGGRIGSSGFEHVFLAEIKGDNIMGLHNWLYFYNEEKRGNLNYKGFTRKLDLGNGKALIKYRFDFHGIQKPVNSMFIGTSPELEMSLYTVCFKVRESAECPLSLNGHRFNIRTYPFRYRGKMLIGSAFPEVLAN